DAWHSTDRRQTLQLKNRPDFDGPLPCAREAARDFNRVVEVSGVDQVEAAELFAGLGERAGRHLALALAGADAGWGRDRIQRRSEQVLALSMKLVRQRYGLRHALLALAFGVTLLIRIAEKHVLHCFFSLGIGRAITLFAQ